MNTAIISGLIILVLLVIMLVAGVPSPLRWEFLPCVQFFRLWIPVLQF